MRPWPRLSLAVLSAAVLSSSLSAQVQRGDGLPQPLPLFPPDNWWNLDISAAPVDSPSTATPGGRTPGRAPTPPAWRSSRAWCAMTRRSARYRSSMRSG